MDHTAGDPGAVDCAVGSADPLNITYEMHLSSKEKQIPCNGDAVCDGETAEEKILEDFSRH